MSQLEEIIFKYFDYGFWYKEILEFLEFVHGYSLSLSSLKRILRRNNKKRRALRCSQQELSDAVERELAGSSNNVGYRRMHRILISKGIQWRREDVRCAIKIRQVVRLESEDVSAVGNIQFQALT